MTAQEVIKNFVKQLANHGYSDSSSVGKNMLDSAARASSRYGNIQEVIDAMKADQVSAEKEAVEEVLGSDYAGKIMSEISSGILDADAKDYDTENKSNAYYDEENDGRSTVRNFIKERKAYIFLEKYCGVILNKKFWFDSSGTAKDWTESSGNDDTGAITGSDAGGSEIKTAESVVPEIFINTYIASTSTAQNIITNDRNWIIKATDADDSITANGADSVDACAGSDKIFVNAGGATVTSGDGEDFITIAEGVNDITFSDLNSQDTLKLEGNFEIASAQIEDNLLVITDKAGRKIRLGDFDSAKEAKINSSTIGEWLANAGISFDNLKTVNYSEGKVLSNVVDEGRIEIDENYYPAQVAAEKISADKNFSNVVDEGRIEIDEDYFPAQVAAEKISVDKNFSNVAAPADVEEDFSVTIDLDTVETDAAGEVMIDGITVGSLSSTFPNASTFTRNGLTIHLLGVSNTTSGDTSKITAKTFDELTDDQKTIFAGLFKWWVGESLNLSEESFGISFNSPTAMIKDMGVFFYDGKGSNTILAAAPYWPRYSDGAITQLMLKINVNYYADISSDDLNGKSSKTTGYLDRTLAHELTHSNMETNINYFVRLPQFIVEGMAELVHGIDDERGNRIFSVAATDSRLNTVLNLTNTGTAQADFYAGGFMFMRYFAKTAAAQTESLPAFGEIFSTVNPDEDGDYFIGGISSSEIASTSAQDFKIGSVSEGVYSVENTGVHQIISNTNNLKIVGLTINDTLLGGDGDNIVETSEGSFIVTGAGADSINIGGQFSTISTGAGNDTVNATDGGHHFINLGDGDNFAAFNQSSVYGNTISSGEGNDSFSFKSSFDASIISGAGDDSIYFGGKSNTICVGEGNDTVRFISSGMEENFIDLGAGNDLATIFGGNNTIIGGEGNDSIFNNGTGNYFVFNSSFGKDTINGFNANDTLLIPDTFDFAQENSVVTVSKKSSGKIKGVINLGGFSDAVNVISGAVAEELEESFVTENFLNETLITGTENDDSITNYGDAVTIDADEGDDLILNYGAKVSICAGLGKNSINNFGASATVNVGAGDDTIFLGEGVKNFSVKNFNSGDEIHFASAVENLETIDGGILAGEVTIGGLSLFTTIEDWSLENNVATHSTKTLAGAILSDDKKFLTYGEGNEEIFTVSGVTSTDGIEIENKIVTVFKSALGASSVSISGGYSLALGEDVPQSSTQEAAWHIGETAIYSGSSTIEGYILSDNQIIYTAADGGETLIELGGIVSAPTIKGNIVKLSAKNFSKEVSVIESGGYDFELNTGIYSGKIFKGSEDADNISNNGASIKIFGGGGNDTLRGGSAKDFLDGEAGDDLLIGGRGNDTFSYSGGKDTIADYSASDKIITGEFVHENFSVDGSDIIFTFGEENSLTVKNGAGKAINLNSVVNFYTEEGIFDKGKKSATLTSATENFSAKNYSNLATIDGSETNAIEILGNGKANLIRAGYNSTISGGKGKDTIFGGEGADIFIYNKGDGKDTIFNFGDGDKISLGSGAEIKDAKIKKGDSIIKIGSGSITVKDTSEITLTSGGSDTIFSNGIFIEENSAKVLGSFNGTINLEEIGVFKADASLAKKKVSISGSASADSLIGGKKGDILIGGSGNDTLWGGKGNDTLTGGDGNDIFIFRAGDGSDVITDFSSGDMLQILNKKGTGFVDYKSNFKNDTLTLAINGGGKIILKNISDSTSFNINGEIFSVIFTSNT